LRGPVRRSRLLSDVQWFSQNGRPGVVFAYGMGQDVLEYV
jgi:hypothetical protein